MTPSLRRIARHLAFAITLSALAAAAGTSDASSRHIRETSKPFYLRDIEVGGVTLPFSPVTVLVMILSAFMITGIFGSSPKSTAAASHILVDGNDAEDRLNKVKREIGGDYAKFQRLAKLHSKCPSGKSAGGKLGTFRPG